jgi:hypothetical protein
MWVVGIMRAGVFRSLPDSPGFAEPLEAKAWAREYLTAHPDLLKKGQDSLTWRLEKAPGDPKNPKK